MIHKKFRVMKNIILLSILILATALQAIAQSIQIDSLVHVIIDKDIIGQVEKHSEIVKRLEWTKPALLAPTIFGILAFCYVIYLHLFGLQKKAEAILTSEQFKIRLDQIVQERVIALAKSKEAEIRGKPVVIVYLPGKDRRKLPKFLFNCGFTNVKAHTTEEHFDIAPNTVVIFNDEDGDFTDEIAEYIKKNEPIENKGHFFYYGSRRFNDDQIRMKNFANSEDTLAARLFESLTYAEKS